MKRTANTGMKNMEKNVPGREVAELAIEGDLIKATPEEIRLVRELKEDLKTIQAGLKVLPRSGRRPLEMTTQMIDVMGLLHTLRKVARQRYIVELVPRLAADIRQMVEDTYLSEDQIRLIGGMVVLIDHYESWVKEDLRLEVLKKHDGTRAEGNLAGS
jgi:hypothetical protein